MWKKSRFFAGPLEAFQSGISWTVEGAPTTRWVCRHKEVLSDVSSHSCACRRGCHPQLLGTPLSFLLPALGLSALQILQMSCSYDCSLSSRAKWGELAKPWYLNCFKKYLLVNNQHKPVYLQCWRKQEGSYKWALQTVNVCNWEICPQAEFFP